MRYGKCEKDGCGQFAVGRFLDAAGCEWTVCRDCFWSMWDDDTNRLEEIEEEDDGSCGNCGGHGGGDYAGIRCLSCNGTGMARRRFDDIDPSYFERYDE